MRAGRDLLGALLFALWCASPALAQTWVPGAPLITPRAGAALVYAQGRLYLIGGVDGRRYLDSVESAPVDADGRIGPWTATTPLPAPRGFAGAAVVGDFIYLGGGARGGHGKVLLAEVIRAPVLSDGRLGVWRPAPNFNLPRRCAKLVHAGPWLITAGGFGGTLLDSVEVARLDELGLPGPWRLLAGHLTRPRYVNAMKAGAGAVYVLGGHDPESGRGLTGTEWAPVGSEGVGSWRPGPALNHGRYALAAAILGGRLYALGGFDGQRYLRSVEVAPISQGAPGPFREGPHLPAPAAGLAAASDGRHLFIVGGTDGRHYLGTSHSLLP